jgi:hypothetical protein
VLDPRLAVEAAFLDQGFVQCPKRLLLMSILEAFFYDFCWWG